jgi:hypothetical protein
VPMVSIRASVATVGIVLIFPVRVAMLRVATMRAARETIRPQLVPFSRAPIKFGPRKTPTLPL